MNDLEAATTPELVGELVGRCESVVLVYVIPGEGKTHFMTEGNLTARIGLAHRLAKQLDAEDAVEELFEDTGADEDEEATG